MFCKYCGKEITDSSKFCQYCGKSLESNTIDLSGKIKTFVSTNKKAVKIVVGLLVCVVIGWIWYINTYSYKIIGEWQREVRIGTEINIFYSDGTYEHRTLTQRENLSTEGKWEIAGNTLTKSFLWEGQKYFDKYEIIKITSEDLIIKGEEATEEQHFKRISPR